MSVARRPAAPPADVPAQLELAAAAWLAPARDRLLAGLRGGRFPHALLLTGRGGLGQEALGLWAAALALCEQPAAGPCGACPGCVLFRAGNHPDYHPVTLEDDAAWIKVDQVRELCRTLAMRSFRGGRQVGMISPAELMNVNAFNALLKTLEAPAESTLLILPVLRQAPLPATIVSRCQRLALAAPEREEAVNWLQARAARPDWPILLELSNGGPLAALALAADGVGELGPELARDLAGLGGSSFDPWRLAEAWLRDRPAERLLWLEHWVQRWLHEALAGGDGVNNNHGCGLPSPSAGMNTRRVLAFHDQLREARAALAGPLNAQLLLEDLLVGLGEAFAAANRRQG